MKYFSFILLLLTILSCQSLNYPDEVTIKQRDVLRSKRSSALGNWDKADPVFYKYYKDCLIPGSNYYPIWFDSINSVMNSVVFSPPGKSRGVVLLLHGYAGNIVGFRNIIKSLLESGLTVAALSLPGHGISGGERGGIDRFEEYGEVVKDYIEILKIKGLEPDFAVGHSTGATSLLIHNEIYGWNFKKVVFIAPLIRSYRWGLSRFVRTLTRPFVNYYNTSWTGVLAVQVFPLSWFDELRKWNKRVKKYKEQDDKLLILQGNEDNVVSWEFNLLRLKQLYVNSETVIYPNSSHTFFMKDTITGIESVKAITSFLE